MADLPITQKNHSGLKKPVYHKSTQVPIAINKAKRGGGNNIKRSNIKKY
tara:strand:- start:413 stop:559 length:147 start_codon:yes stop_codon:yes gene_type:complete